MKLTTKSVIWIIVISAVLLLATFVVLELVGVDEVARRLDGLP